jgi:outer membrane biosynthesis protein TonB
MAFEEYELPGENSLRMLFLSLIIHVLVIGMVWGISVVKFKPKETAIPIDLVVVVNENLEGDENEPPPIQDPVEEPKVIEEPPPVEKVDIPPPKIEKTEAVVVEKEDPAKKQKELEKKRKEEQEKRIKRIRDSLKKPPKKIEPVKKNTNKAEDKLKSIKDRLKPIKGKNVEIKLDGPSGNGRTDKKTLSNDEILKRLAQGYRPGAKTQIATSEMQLCISLIERAFYNNWQPPAWNDSLKEMHLKILFGPGGRVLSYKLVRSSSDAQVDATVLRAASNMHSVPGLTPGFIEQTRKDGGVILRIKVKPQ